MYKLLEKNKRTLVYFPLVIYWIMLLMLTSIPGQSTPDFGISDKIEHAVAYMILTVLLCLTYQFQGKFKMLYRSPFVWTIATVALYGALDEIHQLFIPGRSCDIMDWMADITGAVLGLIFVYIIKHYSRGVTESMGN
ncbi:MAG: VanZ family protein [Ignavibacteria bacterium]